MIIISRPNPKTTVIKKSKLLQLVILGAAIFMIWKVFFGWLDVAPSQDRPNFFDFLREEKLYILWGSAILVSALLYFIKEFKYLYSGEKIIFDGIKRTIEISKNKTVRFNEVSQLQIRIEDRDVCYYHLSMILKSGNRIEIRTNTNSKTIESLADEISEILDVEVVRK
jgi:hypothetical protein